MISLDEWASEKVKDILFSCILNARLKRAGLCSKYFFEMNEADLNDYCQIIIDLHDRK
jgi:hypothetical protein